MTAARVSAEQVKEVVSTSIADAVVLTSMIDTANLFIDTHLSASGLSAAVLAKIELYLAAHFVALSEERGGLVETELGDASEAMSDIYDEGFRATRYGQTALALDTTGTLTRISTTKLNAEFRVV